MTLGRFLGDFGNLRDDQKATYFEFVGT